jgi:hypothetical protein
LAVPQDVQDELDAQLQQRLDTDAS